MLLRPFALIAGLLLAALLSPATAAAQEAPVSGRDYAPIADGRPWQAVPGKIEVVEVFAYTCDHCHRFQPKLEAWKRTLPKDVQVRHLPAAYRLDDAYARSYFAAEAAGRAARTHEATFRAIHDTQALPPRGATIDELATFLETHRVKNARAAMTSAAVDAKMQAAQAFAQRSGIPGTPSLIVDGRYLVLGENFDDLLRNAERVIALARAAGR